MIDRGRFNVIGVEVNAVDYEAAVAKIVSAAQDNRPLGVSALAVHGVMTGAQDEEHRHRLNNLELVVPDGQPVRWALNLLHGTALEDRVYGPNLMLETCRAAEREGLGVYLFGGTEDLLDRLETNLLNEFPELRISRKRPSLFRSMTEAEASALVADVADSGADIVMVGLGCPRQEVWAYEFKDLLNLPVLAVGAAFNFHAGVLDQAPPSLQRYGLEWLYRLIKEPRRLWKRYILLNPHYVYLLMRQKLGVFGGRFGRQSTEPKERLLYG